MIYTIVLTTNQIFLTVSSYISDIIHVYAFPMPTKDFDLAVAGKEDGGRQFIPHISNVLMAFPKVTIMPPPLFFVTLFFFFCLVLLDSNPRVSPMVFIIDFSPTVSYKS